jgi:prephenate dehydrogenase
MQKILIIGNGMIGGSLGMALAQTGKYIIDYADEKTDLSNVDYICPTLVKHFVENGQTSIMQVYNFIVNATGDFPSILYKAMEYKIPIIDVSSFQEYRSPYHITYQTQITSESQIFCHPICGSEKSGRENARADLFQGKTCIITTESRKQDLIAFATDIFTDIEMNVQFCETVEEHNKNLAYTSHLIQYLAFNDNFKTLHPVFERLSNSNKEMWEKIFKKNKVNIENALEDLLGIYVSQQTQNIFEAFKILVKDIPEYFYGTALQKILIKNI